MIDNWLSVKGSAEITIDFEILALYVITSVVKGPFDN